MVNDLVGVELEPRAGAMVGGGWGWGGLVLVREAKSLGLKLVMPVPLCMISGSSLPSLGLSFPTMGKTV